MPYIEVIQKYAVFEGRAKRTEFWLFMLIHYIIALTLSIVGVLLIFAGSIIGFAVLFVLAVYVLATILPYLAVGARRLHDSGKSGWLQLLYLTYPIPVVDLVVLVIMIVLFALPSQDDNQYGPRPE